MTVVGSTWKPGAGSCFIELKEVMVGICWSGFGIWFSVLVEDTCYKGSFTYYNVITF